MTRNTRPTLMSRRSSYISTDTAIRASSGSDTGIRQHLASVIRALPLRTLRSKLEGNDYWADKGIPKSPLLHLLKSNVAPSDSEIITIRALITEVDVRIEELNHNHLPTSQATESRLLEFVQVHKALLSPVRYLPSEVLQEIFLHYCDHGLTNPPISKIPWRLGHISHRWREIALSLPALWDNIPPIYFYMKSHSNPSYDRAITQLMERSGTSPTLKLYISFFSQKKVPRSSIFKTVVRHSERLESLRMTINDMHTTNHFQGLKGRLPNLRNLTLALPSTYSNDGRNFDIFETAPALRKVELVWSHPGDSIRLLLPWSQITHFSDMLQSMSIAPYVPLSSLPSLSYLDINKDIYRDADFFFHDPSQYEPVTLSRLHTLKVHDHCNVDTGVFLDSLTIPAVEDIEISLPESLVPHLASLLSRSHEPSRLQKLAFRTISLQAGELSDLLNLIPQLIELDISVPPMADILRLIDCEGDIILVPMLRGLYMYDMHDDDRLSESIECVKRLAQARCELGGKDSEDAIKPSLASRNTLDILRIVFNSNEIRDVSQMKLNDWSFTPGEAEAVAVDILFRWSMRLNTCLSKKSIPKGRGEHNSDMLDQLFTCIELCKAITTINVLRMTNIHVYLRRIIVEDWLTTLGQDKFKQKAMDVMNGWEQLLLNNLDDYCWARVASSSESPARYHSLVYVPRDKRHAMRMASNSYALSIVYGLKLEHPFEETLWQRERRTRVT